MLQARACKRRVAILKFQLWVYQGHARTLKDELDRLSQLAEASRNEAMEHGRQAEEFKAHAVSLNEAVDNLKQQGHQAHSVTDQRTAVAVGGAATGGVVASIYGGSIAQTAIGGAACVSAGVLSGGLALLAAVVYFAAPGRESEADRQRAASEHVDAAIARLSSARSNAHLIAQQAAERQAQAAAESQRMGQRMSDASLWLFVKVAALKKATVRAEEEAEYAQNAKDSAEKTWSKTFQYSAVKLLPMMLALHILVESAVLQSAYVQGVSGNIDWQESVELVWAERKWNVYFPHILHRLHWITHWGEICRFVNGFS